MTPSAFPIPDLWRFEREAWARGCVRVCGIDEVGRGPLAGPVLAAAVILPRDFRLPGLTDSKKLAPQKRERLGEQLASNPAIRWKVAAIEPSEIDRLNILRATWEAMTRARAELDPQPDWTLVDGLRVPPLGERQTSIIGGDGSSISIAAASVIAKVTRDRWMIEMDRRYPGYGFADHKGYGTRAHLAALQKKGPCPIHRHSFAPVRLAAGGPDRS